jgi:hypothetical protein
VTSHYVRMLIGCALVLGAVLLLPWFGYGAASGSLAFGLLMLACCVGPMLFMALRGGRRGDGDRGEESPREGQKADKHAGPKPRGGGSCH